MIGSRSFPPQSREFSQSKTLLFQDTLEFRRRTQIVRVGLPEGPAFEAKMGATLTVAEMLPRLIKVRSASMAGLGLG